MLKVQVDARVWYQHRCGVGALLSSGRWVGVTLEEPSFPNAVRAWYKVIAPHRMRYVDWPERG